MEKIKKIRTKILNIIINKKDQIQCGRQRSCLQKWNLRAKIMAIADLTDGFKPKKSKGKKKHKKKDGKKEKKENENEENEEKKEGEENK